MLHLIQTILRCHWEHDIVGKYSSATRHCQRSNSALVASRGDEQQLAAARNPRAFERIDQLGLQSYVSVRKNTHAPSRQRCWRTDSMQALHPGGENDILQCPPNRAACTPSLPKPAKEPPLSLPSNVLAALVVSSTSWHPSGRAKHPDCTNTCTVALHAAGRGHHIHEQAKLPVAEPHRRHHSMQNGLQGLTGATIFIVDRNGQRNYHRNRSGSHPW